jgi:RNA 2',3'-cyclic 3'-phosphodiesterase
MAPPAASLRRLFFALWPQEASRACLSAQIRARLPRAARAVPPANLHLTLVFLGSVANERLPEVHSIAMQVCARLTPQMLQIRLSRLAHWREPQILVALPETQPAPLEHLAEALSQALRGAGFTPDLKPFRAHVTVARKVTHPPETLALSAVSWRFSDYVLIESRSGAAGPIYSIVQSYPLVKAQKVRE